MEGSVKRTRSILSTRRDKLNYLSIFSWDLYHLTLTHYYTNTSHSPFFPSLFSLSIVTVEDNSGLTLYVFKLCPTYFNLATRKSRLNKEVWNRQVEPSSSIVNGHKDFSLIFWPMVFWTGTSGWGGIWHGLLYGKFTPLDVLEFKLASFRGLKSSNGTGQWMYDY